MRGEGGSLLRLRRKPPPHGRRWLPSWAMDRRAGTLPPAPSHTHTHTLTLTPVLQAGLHVGLMPGGPAPRTTSQQNMLRDTPPQPPTPRLANAEVLGKAGGTHPPSRAALSLTVLDADVAHWGCRMWGLGEDSVPDQQHINPGAAGHGVQAQHALGPVSTTPDTREQRLAGPPCVRAVVTCTC